MKLNATRNEKMKMVLACLEDGLPFFPAFGLEMDYDSDQYDAARDALVERSGEDEDGICIETIWAEIVASGGDLIFTDQENDGEEVGRLNLKTIDANWDKLLTAVPNSVTAILSDNYDANNTDCVMQVLIFGEVVYG